MSPAVAVGIFTAGSSAKLAPESAGSDRQRIAPGRMKARDAGHRWISDGDRAIVARRADRTAAAHPMRTATLVEIRKLAVRRYRRETDPDLARTESDDDAQHGGRQHIGSGRRRDTRRPQSAPGRTRTVVDGMVLQVDAQRAASSARHAQ